MPPSRSLARIALVSLLAACGGTTSQPVATDAGGQDARVDGVAPGDDVSDAASIDAPLDSPAGYLACMSESGQLDGLLKACQSDSDCVIEQEQTDCCGTILYVGVDTASVAAFSACEAAWVAHFPGCGCASNQTKTEDGKATVLGSDASAPQVHCTDFTMNGGVCMTFTP